MHISLYFFKVIFYFQLMVGLVYITQVYKNGFGT
jgi:hypothetical protein